MRQANSEANIAVKRRNKNRTAPSAVQDAPGIGHNRPPDDEAERWLKLIGPREPEARQPFQCGAPWTGHATEEELRRLARLQVRIEIRQRAVAEMIAERRRIMNRCIRRMRRSDGKD